MPKRFYEIIFSIIGITRIFTKFSFESRDGFSPDAVRLVLDRSRFPKVKEIRLVGLDSDFRAG